MEGVKPLLDKTLIPFKEVNNHHWPLIEPLPTTKLLDVISFDPAWLPSGIRDWIIDCAERSGCPIDYLVVSAMVGMAVLIGRKCSMHPKQYDDWKVVPNLWGVVIGRPSAMKTPAIQAMLKPLKMIERKEKEAYELERSEFELQQVIEKATEEGEISRLKKSVKKCNEIEIKAAKEKIRFNHGSKNKKPKLKRLLINDTTVEKLGELLNENPNGLLQYRDELIGWLNSLEREDRRSDKAFFLECFNGSGEYNFDRIGRGTINIGSTTLSLIGGITPGRLKPYIYGANKQGVDDDGLVQRLQLAVFPNDNGGPWANVDRVPNVHAEATAFEVYQNLYDLPADESKNLRFSDAGQKVFNIWRNQLERMIRDPGIHPALESHLAKYRSLMPSIALILQLAEDPKSDCVSEDSANKAVFWCDYLESHARRIYNMGSDMNLDNAHLILNRRSKLPSPFKIRDITNNKWTGLPDKATVKAALEILLDHNYLREEEIKTMGRSSIIYHWNPNI